MEQIWLGSLRADFVKCSECTAVECGVFKTADNLWSHIALVHSYWIPFQCTLCPTVFLATENLLKKHYKQNHPGKVPKAIYTYDEERKVEIRRIFNESLMRTNSKNTKIKSRNITKPLTSSARRITNTAKLVDQVLQLPMPAVDSDVESREEEEIVDKHVKKTEPKGNFSRVETLLQTLQSRAENSPPPPDTTTEMDESSLPNMNQKEKPLHNTVPGSTPGRKILDKSPPKKRKRVIPKKTKKTDKSREIFCRLCSKMVTQGGRHIWYTHMERKRFSCTECNFVSFRPNQMKQHAAYKHKRITGTGWTDNTQELTAEYKNVFTLAFGKDPKGYNAKSVHTALRPLSPISGVTPLDASCKLCDRVCEPNHKSEHVWRYHMAVRRYRCKLCGKNYSMYYMRKHARESHKLDENECCWTDNGSALMVNEYETTFAAAYGSYKGTPLSTKALQASKARAATVAE